MRLLPALALAFLAGTSTPRATLAQLQAIKEPGKALTGKLALSTERVIAFKDGYSLIVKHAKGVADDRGQVWTPEVPDAAVLGCFWAMSDSGEALAMRAEWVEDKRLESKEQACLSMAELLRANVGRKATLRLSNEAKDAREITGTIAEVLEVLPPADTDDVALRAEATAATPPPARTVRPLAPTGGVFVVIQQPDARLVLPIDQVRELNGADLKTRAIHREQITDRSKRLSFAAAPGKEISLSLYYFTPGVRWIPTYRLENIDSESPRLSLQGEILNEFEDLAGAKVDLVAGVPNFRFKSLISPLSLESTLRNALVVAAPDLMGRRGQLSNAMFSQRGGEWNRDESTTTPGATNAPVMTSGGEQDLYVYQTGPMTLTKGGRVTLPLWSEPIGLSHVYTLHIEANQEARPEPRQSSGMYGQAAVDEGFEGGPQSPLKLLRHQVWHQLELANQGQRPWTTGPALVLKEALPIAQELLTYTPMNGTTRLPLTVAVDVRGDYKEEEVSRRANAMDWSSHSFGLITKRGTVTVTNHRKDPSRMCITMSIPGKATETSDSGVIQIDDFRQSEWQSNWSYRINNHSEVLWEFELQGGESKTLTCSYLFYVP